MKNINDRQVSTHISLNQKRVSGEVQPQQAVASSLRATVPLNGFDAQLPPGYLRLDRVVFLDFDGVLHPDVGDKEMLFCFMPEFCSVLREVDPRGEMPIVISSMWRFDETIEQLRRHFPTDIGRQIVGVTQDLLEQGAWEASGPWAAGGSSARVGVRQRECQAWMQAYAPAGQWLAIDDRASYFADDCPNLFKVPGLYEDEGGGISSVVAEALKDRLQDFLSDVPEAPVSAQGLNHPS